MALLTSTALQGYRDYTKRTVDYARYKIGSTYYRAKIEDIEILSNGLVEISFKIEIKSGSGTVSEVQLFDNNNNLWFSGNENLQMKDVSEGFLYVVQIEIKEASS